MIVDINEEELDQISLGINFMKCLKLISDRGYDIGSFYIQANVLSEYYNYIECCQDLLSILFGNKFSVDSIEEDEESTEFLERIGLSLWFGADECEQYLFDLKNDYIEEYVRYLEAEPNLELRYDLQEKLDKMIGMAPYTDDYSTWNCFVADDYSGVYCYVTNFDFMSFDFIKKLIDIIEFCKEECEKRKEVVK